MKLDQLPSRPISDCSKNRVGVRGGMRDDIQAFGNRRFEVLARKWLKNYVTSHEGQCGDSNGIVALSRVRRWVQN